MSHLIALIFDDPFKGEEARALLHRVAGEGLVEIDDTVLIWHSVDGKMSVSQEEKFIPKGQTAGHVLGLIAGAITGTMPLVLVGKLASRLLSKLTNEGSTRTFIDNVKKEIEPGKSALVALTQSDPERRQMVADRLQGLQPKILQTDVPTGLLEAIEDEIKQHRAA